ncbi:hypothetical protein MUK42_37680 [Musa troglodytarum]|uniref:Secreted protein n=2 Tax=Musa troglodytarum TaxID=320322 RepID=A0A9E7F7D2_9LILI|nr:hypothetical protein MUK42_37680 [Musa troglodytarum]
MLILAMVSMVWWTCMQLWLSRATRAAWGVRVVGATRRSRRRHRALLQRPQQQAALLPPPLVSLQCPRRRERLQAARNQQEEQQELRGRGGHDRSNELVERSSS